MANGVFGGFVALFVFVVDLYIHFFTTLLRHHTGKRTKKQEKKMGAIGFAVYLDQLERFGASDDGYDVDVLLLYNDDTPVSKVISAVNRFRADGKSVRATNTLDKSVSYKKLFGFGKPKR